MTPGTPLTGNTRRQPGNSETFQRQGIHLKETNDCLIVLSHSVKPFFVSGKLSRHALHCRHIVLYLFIQSFFRFIFIIYFYLYITYLSFPYPASQRETYNRLPVTKVQYRWIKFKNPEYKFVMLGISSFQMERQKFIDKKD